MKLELIFKKLAQRWFVDIPWAGSIDDLQMVNGADDFLEWYVTEYPDNKEVVTLKVDTEIEVGRNDLYFHITPQQDEFGATYEWISCSDVPVPSIWLCNVALTLFGGEFPRYFFVYR